ncbi:Uu.00g035480.m01.CDS01 [Anthostomella pinea]|uniref:Uu.00g035480.m01.CDS01 n=1 Tax=Anthostomella pinea TaxID=933095 RepID=A0AAI8VA87_9PEZI|nr:Uu.00g035480.m01.CDS01 [Anthostomella pinea]
MQTKLIAIIAALAATSAAQTLQPGDIPTGCGTICQSTVQLTQQCQSQSGGDTSGGGYQSCVCNAQDSKTHITECGGCLEARGVVGSNGNGGNSTQTIESLLKACGWQAISNRTSSSSASASGAGGAATQTDSNGNPTSTAIPGVAAAATFGPGVLIAGALLPFL